MKKAFLCALAVLVPISAFAATAKIPSETELKAMTLESMLDFNKSVQADDFTVLYESISKLWQDQTSPEKLKALFKVFVDKEIDLSPIKKVEPVFNQPAAIDADDVLVVNGYYPTTPKRVVFRLKYIFEKSDWKLVGIKIDVQD